MAGRFSVEAVFKAVDRVTRPVTRMQNRVGKFTRSMTRGFTRLNRAVNKFGRGLRRAGATAAVGIGIAGAAMTNVLGAGADFEQAIVNVGAVSLKSRDQIAQLEQQALELGRTTKFTATQAANAMEVLSRAGFSTQEVMSATPAILSAAAASGLEIAEVADHVSNALKGMGLEITEAANVADVLALASSRTNSSIGTLGESIRNVASTARQLNVPFEDVVASVALLQDVGLDASVAGSAMNVMLTKMAAPSVGLQKKMRRLGISFKDAKGDMKTLPDVLQQLSAASKKVGGNFDKVAFLAELVGLRGQKAAANLATLFETGKLEELTKALKNAEGSAKKMADLRMNTVQGSMLLLGSAVDAVKVKIFGLNNGPLKNTIDKMTAWVGANEDLIATKVGEFIGDLITNLSTIGKWIKRIAIGIGVFIAFSLVLKTLIGVLTLVNLVMAANPITLIILGIMAAIAAVAALIFWWDEIKAAFLAAPTWVKVVAGALVFLSGPIGWLITAAVLIIDSWDEVAAFFVGLWDGIVGTFDAAVASVSEIIEKLANSPAAELFTAAWDGTTQFFVDLWEGITSIFTGVIDFFADAWGGLVNVFNSAVDLLSGAIGRVKEIFSGLPEPVKVAIAVLAGPIGWLVGAAALIMEHWEPISEFFSGLWDGIVSTFQKGLDFVTGIFDKMFAIFDDIVGFFADVGSSIASFFGFGDEVKENPAVAKAKVQEAVRPPVHAAPIGPELPPEMIIEPLGVTIEPIVKLVQPIANIVPIPEVTQPEITIAPDIVPEAIKTVPAANDDEFDVDKVQPVAPQLVSPQERIARSIEETSESTAAEVTIRDETGRAEKTAGEFGQNIKLQNSGSF